MHNSLRSAIMSALFAAIIAVLAQVSIPLPISPVPITGQLFGVFLAGALLGGRYGGLALLLYLLLGAMGIPVFAQARAGLAVLVGPSGGYLVGFMIGAFLLGSIVQGARRPGYLRLVLGMTLCLLVSYGLGTAWLAYAARLSFQKALLAGVIPFLPLDLVKLFLAAWVALGVRRSLDAAGLQLPGVQGE